MAKKRIGIKYCGGCNPTYERVEMVEKLQFLLGDRFNFTSYDQQDLDGLIFIQGCERACALESLNQREVPYLSVNKENECRGVVDWLESLNNKKAV